MSCTFLAFVVFLLMCITSATPYFRPWLETRQNPTLRPKADMIYPAGNDGGSCPTAQNNLFNGAVLQSKRRRRRRNLHSTFRVPQPQPHIRPRQLLNTTAPPCSNIAYFGFDDWEKAYDANTPTIMLEGGHKYTLSIRANVLMDKIEAWTAPSGSNKWKAIGKVEPKAANATLVMEPTENTPVHWKIEFQFGHPSGDVAVFSNTPPIPIPVPVATSRKQKRVYKRR